MSFQISVAFGRRLQVEDFVVLWRPAGVLGLGHLPPFLVGQMRPDEADLDERLERLHLGPPQVVGGDDWKAATPVLALQRATLKKSSNLSR